MQWSPQQSAALRKVTAWLNNPRRQQIFRLFGTAGTGKTTLAREIAENVRGTCMFGSFTGKAALVLRKKGCHNAQTLHSMIYSVDDGLDGNPRFSLNQKSPLRNAALLIVDEVSMVDKKLGYDLLSFGTPVLVLGDPGQLPPIEGQGFFVNDSPDVLLTEIHRQAADNPIIRLSMQVREGVALSCGAYGDSKVIRRMDCTQSLIMGSDQVIVGTNRTRRDFNKKIRTIKGIEDPMPTEGEKIICLKNDRERQLLNGGMWNVNDVRCDKEWVSMHVTAEDDPSRPDPVRVDVLQDFFMGTQDELDKWKRKSSDEFDYAYAITGHKSQGSEWPAVVVFDQSGVFGQDASRWLYTAITRAADRVTVVI
jgi:exodeoxyribonuclease-5